MYTNIYSRSTTKRKLLLTIHVSTILFLSNYIFLQISLSVFLGPRASVRHLEHNRGPVVAVHHAVPVYHLQHLRFPGGLVP